MLGSCPTDILARRLHKFTILCGLPITRNPLTLGILFCFLPIQLPL